MATRRKQDTSGSGSAPVGDAPGVGKPLPEPPFRKAEVWTLDGALDEIGAINDQVLERSFAFVLGAGASVSSGIPSGATLAEAWLREMFERTSQEGIDLAAWIERGGSGIAGLTLDNVAEFYSQIFERRFRGDRESGYAYLEAMMEGREPSLGYSLLAEVMKDTRHKVVITTNFDNLLSDALAIHAYKPPLIVGHETLTGFVRPSQRRPLVAKIHRDLLYAPKNDVNGVNDLEQGWHDALKRLFQNHTPIVIGYGGNDGSLMGFLERLEPGSIVGRMYWCQRTGSPPRQLVDKVVSKHTGVFVPISGFDEFMLRLTPRLIRDFDLSKIALRLERLGKRRADRYMTQVELIRRRTDSPSSSSHASEANRQAVQRVLSIALRDESNWWTWEMRARAEEDSERKLEIYASGIKRLPNSAGLTSSLAKLLETKGSLDEAQRLHQEAIRMRPEDIRLQLHYADFLSQHRNDLQAARRIYIEAISMDPTHTEAIARYAHFLAYRIRELADADSAFVRAIETDPNDPVVTRNYARFLIAERHDVPRAREMYRRALALNPGHAETIGNFAYFLDREEGKHLEAKALYEKALRIDRTIPHTLTNYGLCLLTRYHDVVNAERHFVEALELLPDETSCVGNYVSLLINHRGDFESAERVARKACAKEPGNANNMANLAAVLLCRNDYLGAQEAARRAGTLAGPQISQSFAEALLYEALALQALHRPTGEPLVRLKGLLARNFPRVYWEFGAMLNAVFGSESSGDRDLFVALAAAILDRKACSLLDDFEYWRTLQATEPSRSLP